MIDQLEAELYLRTDSEKQIQTLEEFFIKKIYTVLPAITYIDKTLELIEENNGNIPIKDIKMNL